MTPMSAMLKKVVVVFPENASAFVSVLHHADHDFVLLPFTRHYTKGLLGHGGHVSVYTCAGL